MDFTTDQFSLDFTVLVDFHLSHHSLTRVVHSQSPAFNKVALKSSAASTTIYHPDKSSFFSCQFHPLIQIIDYIYFLYICTSQAELWGQCKEFSELPQQQLQDTIWLMCKGQTEKSFDFRRVLLSKNDKKIVYKFSKEFPCKFHFKILP